MTRRILILADDLTGAADSAVAFVDRGAVVALNTPELVHDANVVAFDLNTRIHNPDAAMEGTSQALQLIGPGADDVLFKKVDSALRGNIAHELAATLAWRRSASPDSKRIFAILAPAFPAHHRITRGGYQLHHGQPLHASELWHRERTTPPETIAELLAEADLTSLCLPLNLPRAEEAALIAQMTTSDFAPDVFICDAETDADLKAVVDAALHLDPPPILVGSAGLARQLALATRVGISSLVPEVGNLKGPILIVLGTMAPASHRQAEALSQYAELVPIVVPVTNLLDEGSATLHEASMAIRREMEEGRNILLIAGGGEPLSADESQQLPAKLGNLVRPFVDQAGALIATGGDTARAILVAWGISKLQLFAEVEAGIPCGYALHSNHALAVITKSGGFGDAETLIRAYDFLMNQKAMA